MITVQDQPFPHAVEHNLWDPSLLGWVVQEFMEAEKRPGWKHFSGANEEKYEAGPQFFGPRTREFAGQVAALAPELAEAFSLPPLTMELVGGGYHQIRPGGLLSVHTDFTVSPATGRYRRLNLLVYLNRDWNVWENGGELELWDDQGPAVKIAPEDNTTAIFATSQRSWHGHPDPVKLRYRRSFAAYFYSVEPPPDFTNQDTVWHPRASKR